MGKCGGGSGGGGGDGDYVGVCVVAVVCVIGLSGSVGRHWFWFSRHLRGGVCVRRYGGTNMVQRR